MNFLFLTAVAFAQQSGAPASGAPAAGAPAVGPDLTRMALTIGMLILIFYFIILRPQRTEQRKREELLNSVAKGDEVVTSGGILGKVESVTPEVVTLNVAPKISIQVLRSAIARVDKKKTGGKAEPEVVEK